MTTRADIAAQMILLATRKTQLQSDIEAWACGTATGGPGGDGRYPFANPDGSTFLCPSPAQIDAVLRIDTTAPATLALEPVAATFAPWGAQIAAWAAGSATGGPGGDGRYPFAQPGGGTSLLACPAALTAMAAAAGGSADMVLAEATALTGWMQRMANWSLGTRDGGPNSNGTFPFPQSDGTTLMVRCFDRIIADASGGLNVPQARLRLITTDLAFGPQVGQPATDPNGPSGSTFHQEITLETPFTTPRLIFMNHLGVPITIGPVKVATAAARGGTGNGLTWHTVTVGGQAVFTIPAGENVSSNSGFANNPAYVESDPVTLTSAERADYPAFGLLLVRTFLPAALVNMPLQSEYAPVFRSLYWVNQRDGRTWTSWRVDGDHVSDIATMPALGEETNRWPCAVVKVTSTQSGGRTGTVVQPGDSIQNGGEAGAGAHIWKALQMAGTQAVPFGFVNMGWIGQSTTLYLRRAQKLFPILRPTLACFVGWSPNDNPAPTDVDLARFKANVDAFLALCVQYEVTPMLGTATPTGSYTLAQDNRRKDFNDYVRGKAGVALICDYEPVISDGGSPARFKPGLFVDDLHPSPEGYTAMGAVDAVQMKRVFELQARRFLPVDQTPYSAAVGGSALEGDGVQLHAADSFAAIIAGDARTDTGSQAHPPPAYSFFFGGNASANNGVTP